MMVRWFLAVLIALAVPAADREGKSKHMATYSWHGSSGDSNWNTAGNWTGGVPTGTTNTIIILRTASTGINLNLDRTGDNAGAGLNVASFEIEEGFLYDIGSLTLPLRLTADALIDRGDGELYFSSDAGTSALPTDRVVIDKGDIGRIVYLMGEMIGPSTAITEIEVTRGANVHLGSSAAGSFSCTNLWLAPRYSPQDVYVYGDSSNAIVANVQMGGGGLVVDGIDIGTEINMGGGELHFLGSVIPVLNQLGGLVVHDGRAANYQIITYNALRGFLASTRTGGRKLIGTLKRSPQWQMDYNPILTVNSVQGGQGTFIGGN